MYPRPKRRRYAEPVKMRKSCGVTVPILKELKKRARMVINLQASQKRLDLFKKKLGDSELLRKYAAFKIETEDSNFMVHKHILSMHSPIIEAMFRKKNSADFLKLDNFSSGVVQEMIDFMYTGDLEDSENPMELYELAKKYEIKELQSICEEIILEDLPKSNCLEVFRFGLRHDNNKLKKEAFIAIQSLFPDKTLDENLLNDPKKLDALINAKSDYEAALAEVEVPGSAKKAPQYDSD